MTILLLLACGMLSISGAASTASIPPWQANWIWAAEEESSEMLLARRVFDLASLPESAHLRITASSVYKLYLNGEYVGRGPARSAPHNQSFDVLDVGDLLKEGHNVIAIRGHYQTGTISYHHSGRAGLLAQLDMTMDGKTHTVGTDSTWRVFDDLSWDKQSPRMSRFHLEVSDRVDLRQGLDDWTSDGFDDAAWSHATSLMRTFGWPSPQKDARPQVLTPPWTSLEPRDIPLLEERDVPAIELIQSQPIKGKAFTFMKTAAGQLPIVKSVRLNGKVDLGFAQDKIAGDGWFLLYDFGTVLNGMPQLDIEGPSGTVIDVMCAPFIVDESFTANIVDSQLIDRIVLSGKRDRWESMYFKPTRYMGIVIRNAKGEVKLHSAGIHQMAYPFEMKGSLSTPENTWFEDCWNAAAKTIEVCTTDAYTDNYRERRQYVQTAYYAAMGNYWTFGDTALQRRYLKQAVEEQEANGMMPAYAPRNGDDYMVILDSNTAWIRGLRDYLLHSGDTKSTRNLLPAGRKLMSLLHSFTNENGLLDNPPYAYWLDHTLLDRRGANLCLNGHYIGALKDFAEVLKWLGEPGADVFTERGNNARQSIQEHFWNEEKGLFCDALVDGVQSSLFTEHGNAMALAMGIATSEQAQIISQSLLAEDDASFITRGGGMIMVTPAMSYFFHSGLCRYGYVEESLAMLQRRFGKMLESDTNQTLWEEWWRDGTGRSGEFVKRTRSDAQTESAFPPALFGEFVLGLEFTQPGMKTVEIRVPDCGLKLIDGSVPTPLGLLTISWNLKAGELELKLPEGMQADLFLPSANTPVTISHGKHHLRF